jgi:hypothetical protein
MAAVTFRALGKGALGRLCAHGALGNLTSETVIDIRNR